jgi:diguanylate cyclase (GGDEF)-like protein
MHARRLAAWLLWLAILLARRAGGDPAADPGREWGRFAVTNLRARDLEALGAKAGPQNFALAEDDRGVVYLANNLGVIEFDGRTARLIPLPHRTTALSLDRDGHGRIWVGASGDLGYLDSDARGDLRFVSLLGRVPLAERKFGDVWQTSVTPAGVYFRTPSHLLRWDGRSMRVWKAPQGFHIGNAVEGRLIVREVGRGLATVDGETLHLLPGGERFADEKIFAILPYGDGRLLLIGRTSGATLLDPTGSRPPEKLVTAADSFFSERQVYAGCALPSGKFVIASIRGGIAVIDRDGRLLERIDKRRGLNDETVYFPFVSRDGRLWLGLNDGLSIVSYPSPVTTLPNDGQLGLEGFVESVVRHQGALIVSTGRGIYRLAPAATAEQEPRFVPIGGIATQCYTVLSEGGTLLAATREGIFAIQGDRAAKIDPAFAYRLAPSTVDGRVIVGYDDGIGILERDGATWKVVARAQEAGHEVVGVLDTGDGELWGGTDSGGLYRLVLGQSAAGAQLVVKDHFDEKDGLPEGWVYPVHIDGQLRLGTRDGIYQFDRLRRRFQPDPLFETSLGRRSAFRVEQSSDRNTLWIVSENEVLRFMRTGREWRSAPSAVRKIGAGDRILSFFPERDILWIGGDDGLFRHVVSTDRMPPPPRALIREARLGDGTPLFGGAFSGEGGIVTRQTVDFAPIPHARNSIRFAFTGAGDPSQELSTFLEGFDHSWSDWSREPWKEYTNLPGGNYRFHVRARDAYGQVSPEAMLSFSVLGPWYLRWWALALLVLAILLVIQMIVRIRGAQLRRRNRELERIVEIKTAALREASHTDPLTSLLNRRFFSERVAAERAGPQQVVLLLIDLDFFKSVNDRFGHAAGDAVLVEAAARLRSAAGKYDRLFRWGGEEFLLIADAADTTRPAELARHILSLFASSAFFVTAGKGIPLSVSIGWAPFPMSDPASGPIAIETALDLADRALYQAKTLGRNRAVGYVPAPSRPAPIHDEEIPPTDWLVIPGPPVSQDRTG